MLSPLVIARIRSLFISGAGVAMAIWIGPAHAASSQCAWPHFPGTNVGVCAPLGPQDAQAEASDGSGGVVVVWSDFRSGASDLYAQRLDCSGTRLWPDLGAPVCVAEHDQLTPSIVADAGGAFIFWCDRRSSVDAVYATRLGSDGAPLWSADGIVVSATTSNQRVPRAVADGVGGVIVAWLDFGPGVPGIYAQHLDASGKTLWSANGVLVGSGSPQSLAIVSDGGGGAIIAWGSSNSVFASRVDPDGSQPWPALSISLSSTGTAEPVAIVSDDDGGAVVAWCDTRGGSLDVYAARVRAAGTVAWGATPLCAASGAQAGIALAADGLGGAVACWQDRRGALDDDLYAERIDAQGVLQWQLNGIVVCSLPGEQIQPTMIPDGAGGAIVVWSDARISLGAADLYAQRIDGTGAAVWKPNGVAVSSAPNQQIGPRLETDANGGAIATWIDNRGSGTPRIFSERIDRFGRIGNAEPRISGVHDVPSDQGKHVAVSWDASYLDPAPIHSIQRYRLSRWANGWHPIGDIAATGDASYAFTVTTMSDSSPGGIPYAAFLVEAFDSTNLAVYASAADSGYSIDNIPPAIPDQFTATLADEAVLHWRPSTDPDFLEYHLHADSSPSFVPGPGNLIAVLSDTGYVDSGFQPRFYRLAAVDSSGNVGSFAFAAIPGTAGAPEVADARAAWLEAPIPNPTSGDVALRFGLAREGDVSITVFDLRGRKVRDLVRGRLSAGVHRSAWDGRDEGGNLVASGVYFVRMRGEVSKRRAVLVVH